MHSSRLAESHKNMSRLERNNSIIQNGTDLRKMFALGLIKNSSHIPPYFYYYNVSSTLK